MNMPTYLSHYAKIAAISAAVALLSACNPSAENQALKVEDTAKPVQLANPASTYCASLGGELDIEKQAEGEVGYCSLPSGERIEEWSLYRRDHPSTDTDTSTDTNSNTKSELIKPQVGKPNPATQNCIAQGGNVDLSTSICTLPSGEQIEQWQLYRRDNKVTE